MSAVQTLRAELSPGFAMNGKTYSIHDDLHDEIFISIKFQDDGLLSRDERERLGNALWSELLKLCAERGNQ